MSKVEYTENWLEAPKAPGLYKITNLVTEQYYIGSSIDLKERRRRHWYELVENKHGNRKLQNSFNSYGKENFKFEVILISEEKYAREMEQKYIDEYSPYFNLSKIVDIPAVSRHTIVRYSLEGDFIDTFDSFAAAGRAINKSASLIQRNCRGLTKTAGGYQFKVWYEGILDKVPSAINRQVYRREKHAKEYLRGPIYMWTVEGNLEKVFPNIIETAAELKVECREIYYHLTEKAGNTGKTIKNHIFSINNVFPGDKRIVKKFRPFLQMNPDGLILNEFTDLKDASAKVGGTVNGIRCALHMKDNNNHHKGYYWTFKDEAYPPTESGEGIRRITVTDVKTGEQKVYPNMLTVKKEYGITNTWQLKYYIASQEEYHGNKFDYTIK